MRTIVEKNLQESTSRGSFCFLSLSKIRFSIFTNLEVGYKELKDYLSKYENLGAIAIFNS